MCENLRNAHDERFDFRNHNYWLYECVKRKIGYKPRRGRIQNSTNTRKLTWNSIIIMENIPKKAEESRNQKAPKSRSENCATVATTKDRRRMHNGRTKNTVVLHAVALLLPTVKTKTCRTTIFLCVSLSR